MEVIRGHNHIEPARAGENQLASHGELFLDYLRTLDQETEHGDADFHHFHVQFKSGDELVFLAHALAFQAIDSFRRTGQTVLQINGRALDLLEEWCQKNGYKFDAAVYEHELPGREHAPTPVQNGHSNVEFVPFDASALNGNRFSQDNIEDAIDSGRATVTSSPAPNYFSRQHLNLRRNGIDIP